MVGGPIGGRAGGGRGGGSMASQEEKLVGVVDWLVPHSPSSKSWLNSRWKGQYAYYIGLELQGMTNMS